MMLRCPGAEACMVLWQAGPPLAFTPTFDPYLNGQTRCPPTRMLCDRVCRAVCSTEIAYGGRRLDGAQGSHGAFPR
eukprot:2119833-Rhodomonas_salina.2